MLFNSILPLALVFCAGAAVSAADDPCPVGCSCAFGTTATCIFKNLKQIPPGYFPSIQELNVMGNGIANVGEYDLTGFQEVRKVILTSNVLTELNLNSFGVLTYVTQLEVKTNEIKNIIPLEEGRTLNNLRLVDLRYNKIASVPDGWMDEARNLEELYLSGNPLVIPGGRPYLPNCAKLRILDIHGSDGSQMSAQTFEGLSALETLYLENTGITELGDMVANLLNLKTLYLDSNPLTEVRRGAFSKEQNISRLTFWESKLELVEVAALEGAVSGSVSISGTPLACNCDFEALFWWAVARKVTLYSECRFSNICKFTRKMHYSP